MSENLEAFLNELLTLIMDEDCCYVEGGQKRLDEAAWRIAREFSGLSPHLRIYLKQGVGAGG